MNDRQRGKILETLRALDVRIDDYEAELDKMYTERRKLWAKGRAAEPPITNLDLARASGVSTSAVIKGLKPKAS